MANTFPPAIATPPIDPMIPARRRPGTSTHASRATQASRRVKMRAPPGKPDNVILPGKPKANEAHGDNEPRMARPAPIKASTRDCAPAPEFSRSPSTRLETAVVSALTRALRVFGTETGAGPPNACQKPGASG